VRLAAESPAFAIVAANALRKGVTDVDVFNSRLVVSFEHGATLVFESDEHYEAWEIRSRDDGLLIVCGPGGNLTIWYPQAS
jgi:hypothetical protein